MNYPYLISESTVPAYPLGEPVNGRPRYGMTPEQARAYRWLVANRPHYGEWQICFTEMCAALETERSTAHMHVTGLVERGWLEPGEPNSGHTRCACSRRCAVRREFTPKIKLAAWERCGGFCECCRAKIAGRKPEYDHILPDALGGEPTLENCKVLCSKCHRLKTSGEDVPRIAKTKRTKRKAIGAWPKASRPIQSRGFTRREIDPDT